MLYAVAACSVAVGVGWLWKLHWIALDWVGVVMCLRAQRRGLKIVMKTQHGKHCFYFRTEGKR
jgi:hypothetical protein